MFHRLTALFMLGLVCLLHSFALGANEARWWKGNLHTHSLWSDGDDFPEMIADWYSSQEYHFLSFTEHNTLQENERWIPARAPSVMKAYLDRFGSDWVQLRKVDSEGATREEIRLKPLNEYRSLFEAPDTFLLIQAEEITGRYLTAPVHVNATNLREQIPAPYGTSVVDVMQKAIDAVAAQRAETGRPMFAHINHPNFGWAITAEELMGLRGEQFFEVYNGHPAVRNDGDQVHASTERVWDIILTWRLAKLGLPPMFGIATDDSHNYHQLAPNRSNTGRGWVQVRAPHLTAEHIVLAMEAGDFYASSGVALESFHVEGNAYHVAVAPEPGATYRIRFIGTRTGFDDSNTKITTTSGEALRITHRYSEEVGELFQETEGTEARYTFRGDELYVRAEVVSSAPMARPTEESSPNKAWLPPVAP